MRMLGLIAILVVSTSFLPILVKAEGTNGTQDLDMVYERMEKRLCRGRRMWTVSNLTDAKEACLKDQNCGMFYDSGGRGKWFYSCPFATKRNYGRMVRKSWSSVLYSKDPCEFNNCAIDETCHKRLLGTLGAKIGECKCGNGASCAQNKLAPTCDAKNNQCICGSIGSSSKGCTTNDEVCMDGKCMCGTSETCENNAEDIYCDVENNQCTSDSCVTVECSVSGETCDNGICKCGNETTCEGNTDAPVCDTEKGKCVRYCPYGYDCPDGASTDSCMVDQNGEPKIHAGCFYPSNPDLLMKIWGLDDCARFCDDDPNCKGFSMGTVADISTEIGCLLATTRTDCKSTLGYKQYPVNKNLAVVGSLVEGSNTTSKDYGFTGCYSYSDKFWEKDCKDDDEYDEQLCSDLKKGMGCNDRMVKNSCRETCGFC